MVDTSQSQSSNEPDIRAVGLAQKLLIWAVLASIVGWLFWPLLFITIAFQLYCIFRLAKALSMSTVAAVLYLVAMFIPLASLICLLVLNSKATRTLRNAGIEVGLMGAKKSDLPAVSSESV